MDSIMKKTAFIIGLISLLTACNSGSDDRFMELPDTPAGKASISFDGCPDTCIPKYCIEYLCSLRNRNGC